MPEKFDENGFMERVRAAIEDKSPDSDEAALSVLVQEFHTTVPWANQKPGIQDTAQPNVGVGVAMYYKHPDGDLRVVMMEPNGPNEGKLQIPGGWMDFAMSETERDPKTGEITDLGIAKEPEQQLEAVMREIGEELRGEDGLLLAALDESRFTKLDQMTVSPRGSASMVNGFIYELNKQEYGYLEGLELQQQKSGRVIYSKDDEIKAFHIVKARDILKDRSILAHSDQLSLIQKLQTYINIPSPEEKLNFVRQSLG